MHLKEMTLKVQKHVPLQAVFEMIRVARVEDIKELECLYGQSIYQRLPEHIKWALEEVPERIVIDEEEEKIQAASYTMVCVYHNLWSSYIASKDPIMAKDLIDHIIKVKEERGLRNLYVFCPKEFVDVRVHLVTRGFIPECMRKIDGIDYIVESYDGSFTPNYQIPPIQKRLPVILRNGETRDVKALAETLQKSLPTSFRTIEEAKNCVEKWLAQMPDFTIVAEHNNLPIGVVLLSPEIYPVLDKSLAMLCYIAVEERFRQRGVGKALVDEACHILRRKGKLGMEADVRAHDVQARIFYTKMGFYPFWFSKGYMPHDDGISYRIDFEQTLSSNPSANPRQISLEFE